MFRDFLSGFFSELARSLSTPASSFTPPDNTHIESVPAFRAHLLSLGLTEAEASAVLVERTVAGMRFLHHHRGYSWEQIDDMPATSWLTKPTDEIGYAAYCRLAVQNRAAKRACGLA